MFILTVQDISKVALISQCRGTFIPTVRSSQTTDLTVRKEIDFWGKVYANQEDDREIFPQCNISVQHKKPRQFLPSGKCARPFALNNFTYS